MKMQTCREQGSLKIIAEEYSLYFRADRPYAEIEEKNGERLTQLYVFAGVHTQTGLDDTVEIGPWTVEEKPGEVRVIAQVGSSLWRQKTVRFVCRPAQIRYEVEVEGKGELAQVDYFGGYFSAQLRWGTGFFWSGQDFKQGFNPEPNTDEMNYFYPGEGSTIDMTGVPLPSKGNWFFTPPPFCYSFQGKTGWWGIGVEAAPGGNRFGDFTYHGRRSGFFLSLSYDGHTHVNGHYQLPSVAFYFGENEFEVLERHTQAVRALSELQSNEVSAKPDWWYEPIFCGWGSQCYLASIEKGLAPSYSRQALYGDFLNSLDQEKVNPGIIVLDDKWQATYGNNEVDSDKWPDLKSFIQEQHARGRKVLLWLKAWDPEGIPLTECIVNAAGKPVSVDPSSPAFEHRLRESVRRMLSQDGYGADGFKIDFTARIPSGPGLKTRGDLWGLELLKRYLEILYSEAKLSKADALVMTHTPHPYLADVVDMIRLNDINVGKDVNKAMGLRARVAKIACPNLIIDTDNWPITNRDAWRKYAHIQAELGVPSLYYATHIDSTGEPLMEKDYQLIRETWDCYRERRKARNWTDGLPERQSVERANIIRAASSGNVVGIV